LACALSYPNLIVGSPFDDTNLNGQGSAYIYQVTCPNCISLSNLSAASTCSNSFFNVFFDLNGDTAQVTLSIDGNDYTSDFGTGTNSFFIQASAIPSDYIATIKAVDLYNRCCSDVQQLVITIKPKPVINIAVTPSDTICQGTVVTLTASGAASYVWSSNGETTDTIFVSDSSTYIVTGTSDGCSSDASVVITVKSKPIISISVTPSDTVCQGNVVTLTASGAASYMWAPNGETTDTILVSDSNTYIVTGTNDGCSSDASVVITIKSKPIISIAVTPSDTVCQGNNINCFGCSDLCVGSERRNHRYYLYF
jgi:hypothetical protein